MRFVKASERLPEATHPPCLVIVRWWANGEYLRVSTMTPNQLADAVKWAKLELHEWLDDSIPASIEDEAERLYPYADKNVTLSTATYNSLMDVQRETHITCARQYMGEIEKLRAENNKMAEAVEILTELCAIKKYKDSVGKDSHYEQEQPKAWKRANEFLNRIATEALK